MKASLWHSAFRSLLITFFSVIGFFLALVPFILLFSTFESKDDTIESSYDAKIVANAEGIRKKQSKSAPVVLELNVDGIVGLNTVTQSEVENKLIESRENSLKDRVKGLFIRINTPGGSMTDADGIYRAINEYKQRYKIPVVAYVDGLCASGGMYVACATDEIHASDVSIIGSVGVITTPFLNLSKLIDKIGIEALTIYAGKGKDEMDMLRPWKEGEDKNIQELIQYYYKSFVDLVVKNRPRMSKEALVNEYGAKVFPAEEALAKGYIDVVHATRESALKALLTKMGIEDDYYQVVSMESSNWFANLFKADSSLTSGKIRHEISLQGQIPEKLSNQLLLLYRP